jgi:hypothetical protein
MQHQGQKEIDMQNFTLLFVTQYYKKLNDLHTKLLC